MPRTPRRPSPGRRLPLAALLLAVPVAAAAPPRDALAAAIGVAPTRVELAPDRRASSVTLQNNGADPVLVQVQTFAWTGSPATADLSPTRDLVAMPPVVTIAPGEKQLVRVALRGGEDGGGAGGGVERAYRLVVTEVPPEGADGKALGVRFALRLSLPVFVTPPGSAPLAAWSLERSGKETRLVLDNKGSAHLQVRRISLMSPDRAKVLRVIDEPAYVLPAGRRHWVLPAGTAQPVALKLDTDVGDLEATAAAPQG